MNNGEEVNVPGDVLRVKVRENLSGVFPEGKVRGECPEPTLLIPMLIHVHFNLLLGSDIGLYQLGENIRGDIRKEMCGAKFSKGRIPRGRKFETKCPETLYLYRF